MRRRVRSPHQGWTQRSSSTTRRALFGDRHVYAHRFARDLHAVRRDVPHEGRRAGTRASGIDRVLDRRHVRHRRRALRRPRLRGPHDEVATKRSENRSGARQRRSGGRNRAEAGLAVQHDQRRSDTGTRVPDPDLPPRVRRPIRTTPRYTIEGTGGPVTIDTAGSAIDTLIGVFVDLIPASRRSPASTTSSSNPWARRSRPHSRSTRR